MKKEPANPIRCPVCPLITGRQGLANHLQSQHKEYSHYEEYMKATPVIKQKDLDHPLRLEWRSVNKKAECS
jgi:hypothetical protein